jgi:hypothetical protein
MKLKRLRVLPTVKLAGRVSGELNETLAAYRGYYRHVHGDAIDAWTLVVQIVEAFVEADRDTGRKHRRGTERSRQGVAEWLGPGQSDSWRKIKQNQSRHSSGGGSRRIALAGGWGGIRARSPAAGPW